MDLSNAIARAQMLMSEEYQNKMDTISMGAKKKGGAGISNSELSGMEQQVFGFGGNDTPSVPQVQYQQMQPQTYEQGANIDKLPEFLRESAKKTPIGAGMQGNYMYSEQPVPLGIPTPSVTQKPVAPQVSAPSVGGIDYNYIKYLVETAIKENSGLLTESAAGATFRGMRLVEGNKFQFVDSKGNVYEGVLTLKKRAGTK